MKKTRIGAICAALAAVVVAGGVWYNVNQPAENGEMPQLVSYVDSLDGSTIVEDEDIPLAAKPVVKTTTSTKKSTTRTKMKTKAKKSSTKTATKTIIKKATKTSRAQKVETKTTVKTTTKTALKRKSKIKTVTTTVKTTVRTTTTPLSTTTASSVTASKQTKTNTSAKVNKYVSIRGIAPKAHANILKAYETLNFKVLVNSGVSYSGKFDAREQLITVHTESDEAIYHELGHFLAFLAGNADTKSEFMNIYASEKNNFTGTRNNTAYIKSTSAEYFAESYQDYIERPDVLKKTRPQTYSYIETCIQKVTDQRVVMIRQLYASIWS